jgi:hypothetical protein
MATKQALQHNPLEEDTRIMQEFYKPSHRGMHVNQETSIPVYKRQTYHMRPDHIKQIKAYAFYNERQISDAFYNERQISEVVRQAIDEFFHRHPMKIDS